MTREEADALKPGDVVYYLMRVGNGYSDLIVCRAVVERIYTFIKGDDANVRVIGEDGERFFASPFSIDRSPNDLCDRMRDHCMKEFAEMAEAYRKLDERRRYWELES